MRTWGGIHKTFLLVLQKTRKRILVTQKRVCELRYANLVAHDVFLVGLDGYLHAREQVRRHTHLAERSWVHRVVDGYLPAIIRAETLIRTEWRPPAET